MTAKHRKPPDHRTARRAATLAVAMGAVGLGGAATASAETGPFPHLDQLCYHPAFGRPSPPVYLNGSTESIGVDLVGLRAKNAYCETDAILPPSWGSNGDSDGDGIPDNLDPDS